MALLLKRVAAGIVIAGDGVPDRIGAPPAGVTVVRRADFLDPCATGELSPPPAELRPEEAAAMLFTTGTTTEPKGAVLRHGNLTSYVVSTVEFVAACDSDCSLISVPAYHIAGISAVLSSTCSCRRVVQLPQFDQKDWVELARRECVTQAMVAPTMLELILDVLEESAPPHLPALRTLSYGGGPMPLSVIDRAMQLLPHMDLVNAYGLTETSSTIAVLTPEDHRASWRSSMLPSVAAGPPTWCRRPGTSPSRSTG
jgi:acyl-CoA synthetase (AMP-forming)/AMP-acid ligase II